MFGGIIVVLLGICSFVMLTQPALAFYGGNGNELAETIKDFLNKNFTGSTNCYDMIVFEESQNTYWLIGNIFLIIAIVFCGLLLLFTILNLVLQSAGKNKILGTRIFAIFFFLFAVLSLVMYVLFANELMNTNLEDFVQTIKEGGMIFTVGYGLICFVISSLLTIFFASGKKKSK